MQKFFTAAFLLITANGLSGQNNFVIRGTMNDADGKPVARLPLRLLSLQDSALFRGTTDSAGAFSFRINTPGNYRLSSFSRWFKPVNREIIVSGEWTDLGLITLERQDSAGLGEVVIIRDAAPVKLKGDTTEFSASAYKTNPDATAEDLVGKMPGVTVQNGQVQAQGENVKQVLVDGRPFFGDDPSNTLRNLPAEVVDKIQVFDRRSDQSVATGFDDGNTSKTINIITRQQFRNGTFGRAYAGYGTDERYKTGATLNRFKGAQRLTLLGAANNINEQNFSAEDLMGVMSGGGGMGGMRGGMGGMRGGMGRSGGWGGSPMDNFLVDQKNGITRTAAFGLNYSNKWKKSELSGSYFFNNTSNENTATTNRYYVTGAENGLNYNETNTSTAINANHRLNLRWEYKADSMRSLLVTPRISLQSNRPEYAVSGINSLGSLLLNNTLNTYNADLNGYNASVGLQYNVRYQKRGRSLTLNANPNISGNRGNSAWRTATDQLSDTFPALINDVRSDQNRRTAGGTASVTWTEPAGKNGQLSYSVNGNLILSSSDKKTFGLDTAREAYTRQDTLQSNKFDSRYTAVSGGLAYRWQKGKWSWNVSLNAQQAQLDNEQMFPAAYTLSRPFFNLQPGAMIMFKPTEREGFRLFYRSSNNAPSVDQLQEVYNNSNPLSISTGNASLKQDFQHGMFTRYSWVNVKKGSSLFIMLAGSTTYNYIGTSTEVALRDTWITPEVFLRKGAQLNRPVNMDGQGSVRTFANYSVPLKKLKSNLNLNGGVSFTRTPGMVNGRINHANSIAPSLGVVLSSNISEKLDFTLSSNTAYTTVSNSLQTALNSAFTNQNTRFRVQANPWKGLVFQADLSHQYFSGLSAGLQNNFLLLNAGIGYKFLKKQAAEIRFSAFDLLKQNNSLSRNITETFYEDVQTRVLQRYYMVTFTYNLRAFNGQGQGKGEMPMQRPYGMPPGH